MPKFVSGSTGSFYPNKSGKRSDNEEDITALIPDTTPKDSVKKPSAINKKGTKEQQKNSLDLFKEELIRLQEERNEQRSKLKKSITDASSPSNDLPPGQRISQTPTRPPVVLKPDPRCSTALTLQVNLNPKDRESSMGGSFDNGDPATTNLYLGNINPTVNENDLCDLFGKLGPLASIKVMWPRTDEERARNRNSGFVAYMSRANAERALKTFNGREFRGYDMKLSWAKAIPIPQNPVYVPPEPETVQKEREPQIVTTNVKGTLEPFKREALGDLLRNLDPTKVKIGAAMMFCINHSDAASEIVDCISESLSLLETPFHRKIARFFLVSDILHNCSASVTNASYYRKGFQLKLVSIFENLRDYLINLEDHYKADKFKQKVLSVLGAWKEWTLYEDEFIFSLSNILLGIKKEETSHVVTEGEPVAVSAASKEQEEDLDGEEADDETLERCLESKGLSLRWYMTLELSDDEDQVDGVSNRASQRQNDRSSNSPRNSSKIEADKIRFKTSKWETVDPNEVAGQVVTISKWESMARAEEEQSLESSTCGSTDSNEEGGEPALKKVKSINAQS